MSVQFFAPTPLESASSVVLWMVAFGFEESLCENGYVQTGLDIADAARWRVLTLAGAVDEHVWFFDAR